MADDFTFRDASGNSKTGRAKDLGSGKLSPYQSVFTGLPSTITGTTGIEALSPATGSDTVLSPPAGATHALATVDGGAIRYWENGQSPSSTVGLYVPDGGVIEFTSLANVKIRAATGTPKLHVSYRRYDQ